MPADGTHNLKPALPGEVRNPNGRPVGSKNLRTLLRELVDQEIETEVDGQRVKISKGQLALIQWLNQGIVGKESFDKDGKLIKSIDWKATEAILNHLEGKAKESVELSGKDGGAIEFKITDERMKELEEKRKQRKQNE